MRLFRRKTKQEIESKIRLEVLAQVEEEYLDKLNKQRQKHIKDNQKYKEKVDEECKKQVKEVEVKMGAEINRLKLTNYDLQQQIQSNVKAWNLYKDYIPKLMSVIEVIKSGVYMEFVEKSNKYSEVVNLASEVDFLSERVSKVSPKVNRLLENIKEEKTDQDDQKEVAV